MVKKLLQYFLPVLFILPGLQSVAQDPQFSQYYSAPLNLNPALAGIAYGPRFNLNYRNEWPKIEKGYITTAFSYDQHFDKINSGVGFFFLNDRVAAGVLKTIIVRVNYNYQIQLTKKTGMRIGVNAGLSNKRVDFSALNYNDQINPIYGFQNVGGLPNLTGEQLPASNAINNFDMGAGFVAYSKVLYGGVSFQNIIPMKESFVTQDSAVSDKVPIRANIHAGAAINLQPKKRNSDFYLMPSGMFSIQSGSTQINVGALLSYNFIYGGPYYRHTLNNNDAVIAVIGFKINYFRIGYSYDVNISELQSSGGAHEVSMMINFGDKKGPMSPDRKPRRMECPTSLNF